MPAAWFLRRRRGVATVLALALGALRDGRRRLAARGAARGRRRRRRSWPTSGGVVTTSLTLGSLPALALAPFAALLAYLVPVVTAAPGRPRHTRLHPRRPFRITADGPVVIGNPSEELLVADDAVFALLLAGFGLRRRCRPRGWCAAAAASPRCSRSRSAAPRWPAVAWQVGELLGPGPTRAELAHVGGVVTTSLALGSLAGAGASAPFAALLAYLVGVAVHRRTTSGRRRGRRSPARRTGRRTATGIVAVPPAADLPLRQLTVIGAANCCSGTGTAPSVCSRVSSRRSSRDSAASRRRVADSASSACRSSVVSSAAEATR